MALFKRDDTVDGFRIDVLTEIYQVDPSNNAEIVQFVRERISFMEPGFWYLARYQPMPERSAPDMFAENLKIAIMMHDLAKEVMDGLFYKGTITRTSLHGINWFSIEYDGMPSLLPYSYDHETGKDWTNEEEFPLDKIIVDHRHAEAYFYQRDFAKKIRDLVLDYKSGSPKFPLRFCEGCDSVFRVSRSDQQYCSDRCGNRIRVRRSLKKKKDNLMVPAEGEIINEGV